MKNVSSAVTSAMRTVRAARELNNQAPRAAGVTLININTRTSERCLTNNTGSYLQSNTEQNAATLRAGVSKSANTSFAADRTDLPLGSNTSGAKQRLESKSKILRLLSTYGNPRAKFQGAQKGVQVATSDKNRQPSPRPDISHPIREPLDYVYLDALHDSLSELEGESSTDPSEATYINTSENLQAEESYLSLEDKQTVSDQPLYMSETSAPKNQQPIYENQKNNPFASHIYESIDEMDTSSGKWDRLIGTFTDSNGETWGAYEEDPRVKREPQGKITIELDGVITNVDPLEEPGTQANAAASILKPAEPEQKRDLELEKEPPKTQETEKSKKAKPLQFEKPPADDSLVAALRQRRAAISGDSDSDSDDEN